MTPRRWPRYAVMPMFRAAPNSTPQPILEFKELEPDEVRRSQYRAAVESGVCRRDLKPRCYPSFNKP